MRVPSLQMVTARFSTLSGKAPRAAGSFGFAEPGAGAGADVLLPPFGLALAKYAVSSSADAIASTAALCASAQAAARGGAKPAARARPRRFCVRFSASGSRKSKALEAPRLRGSRAWQVCPRIARRPSSDLHGVAARDPNGELHCGKCQRVAVFRLSDANDGAPARRWFEVDRVRFVGLVGDLGRQFAVAHERREHEERPKADHWVFRLA